MTTSLIETSAETVKKADLQSPLEPIGSKVVIACHPGQERVGEIILPEHAREIPQTGVVLAVGPGRRSEFTGERLEPQLKRGDTVLFGNYAGLNVPGSEEKGAKLLIMDEVDVLAIITADESE